jgi:hypothetical protein
MLVKYAELTNNCEVAKKISVSWVKHPKVEIKEKRNIANCTWKRLFMCIDMYKSWIETNFLCRGVLHFGKELIITYYSMPGSDLPAIKLDFLMLQAQYL